MICRRVRNGGDSVTRSLHQSIATPVNEARGSEMIVQLSEVKKRQLFLTGQ
jgi:hypothetical protein